MGRGEDERNGDGFGSGAEGWPAVGFGDVEGGAFWCGLGWGDGERVARGGGQRGERGAMQRTKILILLIKLLI